MNFTRMTPEGIATFDFTDQLKLLECRIEIGAVGHDREIEHARAHGPVALIPFAGRAIRIAPSIGGIVERPGIDDRPI